eukprot:11727699-Ditylum_brightwellii.AAC.1
MLADVLPDGTMPSFSCTKKEAIKARDMENGSGAHHCKHAAIDEATTNDLSYAPGILSINELIGATADMLKKDGKVQGQDFEVPSESW